MMLDVPGLGGEAFYDDKIATEKTLAGLVFSHLN